MHMNPKINIIIVDDHQIVLDGLSALLKDNEHIHIAFTTTEPQLVVKMMLHHQIDVVITDIMMPQLDGKDLARDIKEKYPDVKILALSMNCDWNTINTMIDQSGISGYALKNIGKEELESAVLKIAAGGMHFSPEVMELLEKGTQTKDPKELAHLTRRELEIIQLIEQEKSNKQIAEELFISERTVETHRKNIFRKTGTNSVLGLVKFAYEKGIVIK